MIKFENITKSFGKRHVLDELSLTVESGDRIALIGLNGAGKTTLFRILLGEYIFEGSVLVDGLSPRENRCEVLGKIGFVPQIPPPLKMPVGELVDFSSNVAGIDSAQIIKVIEQLGLVYKDVKTQTFVKLSGGQKQKILISIALGRDCDILIMDEPAANLDPQARASFFSLLRERPEVTMIISSHRLEEVSALVNRVIEMDYGKITVDKKLEDKDQKNEKSKAA